MTRYTIHHLLGHVACRLLTGITLTEAHLVGEELLKDLPRPYIVVMNHCSHWDPVEMWAYFPDFITFMVKEELHEVPIFGSMSEISGNIPLHRDGTDVTAIKRALKLLRDGFNLAVFAEGTRSYDGRIQPFKEGAVAIASRARVPIVPVVIHGTHKVLPKHGRMLRGARVTLQILTPNLLAMEKDLEREEQAELTLSLEAFMKEAWEKIQRS